MYKNLTLDHQLCFAIYSASNFVIRQYQRELKKFGITYLQYLILLVLWERPDVPLNFLAKRLKQDPGSLSPILKRMQNAGLILKVRKESDERSITIRPTKKAKELMPEISKVQNSVSCSTGLTEEEYTMLRNAALGLTLKLEKNSNANKKVA